MPGRDEPDPSRYVWPDRTPNLQIGVMLRSAIQRRAFVTLDLSQVLETGDPEWQVLHSSSFSPPRSHLAWGA